MKNLIDHILEARVTNLNTILYGDVYNLLNSQEISYSACVVELLDSNVSGKLTTHRLRIVIVDRLLEDESNLLDVYDVSLMQMRNVLNHIQEEYDLETSFTINYIKQDFADHLAGVYCDVNITDLTYFCEFSPIENEDED